MLPFYLFCWNTVNILESLSNIFMSIQLNEDQKMKIINQINNNKYVFFLIMFAIKDF